MNDINNIDKVTKAIALDNSVLLDVHKLSLYPEVKHLVDYFFDYLKKKNKKFEGKNPTKNKTQLNTLIINLYLNYINDKSRYTSIYLRKAYYDDIDERYNQLWITKILIDIVHELHNQGFIELEPGYHNRGKKSDYLREEKSRVTRIRGTDKLFTLFDKNNFHEFMIQVSKDKEVIILRDEINGKQENISYEEIPDTIKWRKNIQKYNRLLEKTYIDIPSLSKSGIKINQRKNKKQFKTIFLTQWDKVVTRVFNNGGWDDGGRFYGGWWQRIPSEDRKHIHFFNTPSSEIDYSGLHINLLYRICNKKMPMKDPYVIEGIPNEGSNRAIVKIILLSIINANDITKAIKSVRRTINFSQYLYDYVNYNEIKWESYIDNILRAHCAIKEYFFTGAGIKLQKFDSMIAEEVINYFTKLDIPILCIHDSFVLPTNHAETLEKVMKEKFDYVCTSLNLRSDGTELSYKGLGINEFQAWLTRPEYKDIFIDNISKKKYEYPEWNKKMEEFRSYQSKE